MSLIRPCQLLTWLFVDQRDYKSCLYRHAIPFVMEQRVKSLRGHNRKGRDDNPLHGSSGTISSVANPMSTKHHKSSFVRIF